MSGEGRTETQRLSLAGLFFFCRISKKQTLQWHYTSRASISIFKSQVVTMQICLRGPPHLTRCLFSPGPGLLLMCLPLVVANSREIISSHWGGGSQGGGGSHGGGGYTVMWVGSVALTFPPGPSACVGFVFKLSSS